jgi:hypothetical protein
MKKWRRYEVLLPVRFNDGRDIPKKLHAEALDEMVSKFEAVSFDNRKVEGLWQNKGVLYRDQLSRIVVDIPDTVTNRKWMKRFKARWKERLQQIELWMISYRIEVE